jgi:hypothetical protein
MSALMFDVSEGDIMNAIAIAIAESFSGERRDAMIRDIVRAHLAYKESVYDKETLLAKRVGKIIRDIAEQKLAEVVQSWEPDIEAVVNRCLGPVCKATVLEQLERAIQRVALGKFRLDATIDAEERCDES